MRVKLAAREWVLGKRIGAGGFGSVFEAKSSEENEPAVAKLVPKAPGAQRELLFVELTGVHNVVPIIDSGETPDHWVLVMPRAEKSLRQHLDELAAPCTASDALTIVSDITTTLADLDGKVIHRDLKPENILLLNGRWCLADFGISRYAEATTAPDTQKFALSPPYAAPERWRLQRATIATDVYALGVIAFEVLAGKRPFAGPNEHDFREQHLHQDPPALANMPAALDALINECLYKAPEARPNPANILARLKRIGVAAVSPGLAKLQRANLAEVVRRGESARQASAQQSDSEKRRALADGAAKSFKRIGDELLKAIVAAAPAASVTPGAVGWEIELHQAQLEFGRMQATPLAPWSREPPAFTVIADALVVLRMPRNQYGYEGRGHSLWFCDAQEADRFQWYETAFMISPMIGRVSPVAPFPLSPGEESAKALWVGMAEFQLAWPFTPLTINSLEEFIDRWATWLADASLGRLHYPDAMPERPPQGSWRQK